AGALRGVGALSQRAGGLYAGAGCRLDHPPHAGPDGRTGDAGGPGGPEAAVRSGRLARRRLRPLTFAPFHHPGGTRPMALSFLEFEQPIAELEAKIEELGHVTSDSKVNIAEEIARLQRKSR